MDTGGLVEGKEPTVAHIPYLRNVPQTPLEILVSSPVGDPGIQFEGLGLKGLRPSI